MNDSDLIIQQTRNWIANVVVGCNFCPFAAREVNRHSIHFQVSDHGGTEECLALFLQECIRLDENDRIETSFLILPEGFAHFNEYLHLVDLCEQLLHQEGYEGVYQVASFHPDYSFAGVSAGDPANYTNRSVYPMLHLLREESIEKALLHYSDPDKIPVRNVSYAREKGIDFMKKLRDDCFRV